MKFFVSSFWIAVLVYVFTATSCTDPLEVGAQLLDEDRANVGFTDTFTLVARTEVHDSVSAFSPGSGAIATFLFGRTEDPYFGITEAGFYLETLLQRDLGGNVVPFFQEGNTQGYTLDSVVLVLPIDSNGIYGNIAGTYDLEVYEVTEPILPIDIEDGAAQSFFSNITYEVNPMPLGTTTFIPDFYDTLFVKKDININTLDTIDFRAPHVRVRLDDAFGQSFFNQAEETFETDSAYLEFNPGFYVKPVGVSPGLMNLNVNRSWTGLYFYYRAGNDTLTYSFESRSIGRRVSNYKHDYDGYVLGDFLDNGSDTDSLLFLQGMQGTRIAFEIPGLKNFDGRVINKAEVEFTVAVPEDYDIDFRTPADQIVLLRRSDDGEFLVIRDVAVVPNDLDFYFGGQPIREENGDRLYRMNMSIHAQYLIDGTEPETIYIAVLPRAGNAEQVILKGPGANVDPPILKVSFTEL